jgi:hypothetical protein
MWAAGDADALTFDSLQAACHVQFRGVCVAASIKDRKEVVRTILAHPCEANIQLWCRHARFRISRILRELGWHRGLTQAQCIQWDVKRH